MPRKYRPPASRRRKAKKTSVPYAAPEVTEDGEFPAEADEEPEAYSPPSDDEAVQAASPLPRRSSARHVARDYSHVRGEIMRIVLIAGFLIVALLITAVLRD